MYKSPIEIYTTDIHSQMTKKMDDVIWEAVLKYDVVVNKEELVKALKYDRDQYGKGFKDAEMIFKREIDYEVIRKAMWEVFREENYPTLTYQNIDYLAEKVLKKLQGGE